MGDGAVRPRCPHQHDLRGANGVQALDLVGQARPEWRPAIRNYFTLLAEEIAAGKEAEASRELASALEKAVADLQGATMWLMQNGMANPDNAGAASYSYMNLMGLVTLGLMWLRMAKASGAALAMAARTRRSTRPSWSPPASSRAHPAPGRRRAAQDRGRRRVADGAAGGGVLIWLMALAPEAGRRMGRWGSGSCEMGDGSSDRRMTSKASSSRDQHAAPLLIDAALRDEG